ncbi:MAG: SMC-Scp complex subunit ScpB [Candidatus Ranarchaeia archaeon]|jgi:segregation and condensation protein B
MSSKSSTNVRALLEAVLYAAGRPVTVEELIKITGVRDGQKIRRVLELLVEEFNSRDGALEIVELSQDRFSLQLRVDISPRVSSLAQGGLVSLGALKTLTFIAMKQPVMQSTVVKYRGSHSYSHVQELLGHSFITAEPYKRTKLLRTSEKFSNYFGLPRDYPGLKTQLQWLLKKQGYRGPEIRTEVTKVEER